MFFFLFSSSNLLIILYQLTMFEAPSFCNVLLTFFSKYTSEKGGNSKNKITVLIILPGTPSYNTLKFSRYHDYKFSTSKSAKEVASKKIE